MQQIINFLVRNRIFLLYLTLMFISLSLTVGSSSFHRSSFFNSSNWLSAGIYNISSSISAYFSLEEENNKLAAENKHLREEVYNTRVPGVVKLDSTQKHFLVSTAKVIKNSYANSKNYLTINKGAGNQIAVDMGVVSYFGVIGIVESISKNYATVQSILNTNSNINAKLLRTNHFGSLVWDGRDNDKVQLVDIPKLAPITVGDTIVTGGMSSIFPENIPIGVVKSYDFDTSQSLYTITVDLFNDMTNLRTVYVIGNKDREEIIALEAKTEEDAQ